MPDAKSTLDNYTSILLRGNKLQHLNFRSLLKVFPQVVLFDVRDIDALLCGDIKQFQPFKLITLISDCTYSTTEIPTNTTPDIPATFSRKPPTHHQDSPSLSSASAKTFSKNNRPAALEAVEDSST